MHRRYRNHGRQLLRGCKDFVKGIAFLVCLSACAQHHDASGLVLGVNEEAATVTVSHEPVAGYMDAMVMPFTAANRAELRDVHPGDRIAFRMTVRRERTTIDRVRILSAAPTTPHPVDPSTPPPLAVGAAVPDITLIDQNGDSVSLAALHGKVVVVSFIYTRCPLPDYCPRVMTNLASLRDRFRERLDRDLVLLTVTFDPQHDTPETLKAYGDRYGANIPGWHLLTGTREATTRFCSLLGVEFYPEEGMLTHTLQTAVITRDGHLAARAEGRAFSARQLADLVESQLSAR